MDLSQQIAEFISSELTKAEKAESTDVLVADFDDDEDARWFAVMLLGSKQAFMHEVGREEGEVRNDIARHYAILPNPSQKVPSYAIVRASTMEIGYVDKKRKIAGEDRMLIPDGLLQCDTGVSGKEVIDTVTRVVEEVAEEHGANTAVALAKVKAAVAEKVEDDEELPPWDIVDEVFEDEPVIKESVRAALTEEKVPSACRGAQAGRTRGRAQSQDSYRHGHRDQLPGRDGFELRVYRVRQRAQRPHLHRAQKHRVN